VEPTLHRKILTLRAFLLAHGVDTDYTAAINLLAEYGFDELRKSEFSARLLERLGDQAALDEANKKAIVRDWPEGRMPGVGTKSLESEAKENRPSVIHRGQSPPPAKSELRPVQARCVKCKVSRQMVRPRIVTTKNGKEGIRGTCPVCGSAMFSFGIPR